MKALLATLSFVGLLAFAMLPSTVGAQVQEQPKGFVQDVTKSDMKQLRDMVTNMGYEVTDLSTELGKEKFAFTVTRSELNIPIGVEITPSKNYVWFTVNLKDTSKDPEFATKALQILKQNGKIQPTQFYVTSKDFLMMGLPLDNRNVDSTVLRRNIEKIVGDVVSTKDLWQ